MKIIVGLGNIGEKYLRNRHNIGFVSLDVFVDELEKDGQSIKWKEETKLKAITAKCQHQGKEIILAKPTTLMNNSGEAVSKILNFYKAPTKDLIVIYDDIDLPLGSVRVREKGSAGTHNGMRSIIQEIGSTEFTRIRIGIESRGEHAPKLQDLSSFVLSNFLDAEITDLKNAIQEAINQLEALIG